jgi:hypothetical protein
MMECSETMTFSGVADKSDDRSCSRQLPGRRPSRSPVLVVSEEVVSPPSAGTSEDEILTVFADIDTATPAIDEQGGSCAPIQKIARL